jgi:hypothetical protein
LGLAVVFRDTYVHILGWLKRACISFLILYSNSKQHYNMSWVNILQVTEMDTFIPDVEAVVFGVCRGEKVLNANVCK